MAAALEVAGLGELTSLECFAEATPEVVDQLLNEAGRFIAEEIGPLNRIGDVVGSTLGPDSAVSTPPGFVKAYARWVEAGWGALSADPEFGGGGFPLLVGTALQEMLKGANLAFSLCPMLTQGAIELLGRYGSDEQKQRYLPKLISGEWSGTMNLTEPQAGSDVGALTTKAVRNDDGTWRISGSKIFITWGDHDLTENIVHLVLARSEGAPAGTRGISCFLVPKYLIGPDGRLGARNDVTCVHLEHKLGIHASPTCQLSYGEHGGAVGELVGEECRGMEAMFVMMNRARLSVGVEGLGLSWRAYDQARSFAQERVQGRPLGTGGPGAIVGHPDVRRNLLVMATTIEAMRHLLYANAAAIDVAEHHPDADRAAAASERAAVLTPLSKAWCTDEGVSLTSLAVQIFGGMGYVEETGVAQYLRDVRITPIYEGTNGIQAIDLVTRKVGLRNGAAVRDLLDELGTYVTASASDQGAGEESRPELDLRPGAEMMREGLKVAGRATDWIVDHQGDPASVLAGATPYLRLLATVTGGGLLLKAALIATRHAAMAKPAERTWWEGRITAARFYCEQVVPTVAGLLPAIVGDVDLVTGNASDLVLETNG
jgi:alkylation response protein AidB-like acyl-CoA dehydrogenase